MVRYGSRFPGTRLGRFVAALAVLVAWSGCSFETTSDDKPTSARIRVEGTSPVTLKLIVSTDFFEQLNLTTGARTVIFNSSDTLDLMLPYDETVPLNTFASVYFEVYNPEVPTASIRMRVNLDNGEEFDQAATLADKAKLIYYFVFDEFTF